MKNNNNNNKNFSIEKALYVFILLCSIILLVVFYKFFYLKEGFDNDHEKMIILIGDSILKNNVYVAKDKSVEDFLKQQHKGKLINLAKDNSTLSDIYDQINQLDPVLNDKNTIIFVSIGGNDILNEYVYVNQDMDIDDFKKLNEIYSNYKNALKILRDKLSNAKLVLLNLYYPKSLKYAKYREIIKKWNDLLFEYTMEPKNGVNDIIDLSLIMTDINDFALSIEPSEKGSVKISREILKISK